MWEKRLNKGKYQQCSQVKPKKCIALLLVDVETQVIPHIKAKEEIYSPKKWQGNQNKQDVGKQKVKHENWQWNRN